MLVRLRLSAVSCVLMSVFALQTGANAQLKVQVTRQASNAIPIAIAPFVGNAPVSIADIVSNDLARSGRFSVLPSARIPQSNLSALSNLTPEAWQNTGVSYIALGQNNASEIQFELGSIVGQPVEGRTFSVRSPQDFSSAAHQISDIIYERLTGEPGAFNSRIAYVSTNGQQYGLVVADVDGMNPQVILTSNEPIFSPAWSPDGRYLAYASLENKQAQLVLQDVFNGQRRIISNAPGINSAPSFSPTGDRIVFTSSKDGNPEVYVASISGGGAQRLTNHPGIDTEPTWATGGSIYFTSDRGGTPQIYRMSASGGEPVRVTYEGNYNAHPSVSYDGKKLAMMQRTGKGFGIAVMDLQTKKVTVLSQGGKDEAPSFSGNGQMIIFSNGRGGLETISVDGGARQTFGASGLDLREPAWSAKLP